MSRINHYFARRLGQAWAGPIDLEKLASAPVLPIVFDDELGLALPQWDTTIGFEAPPPPLDIASGIETEIILARLGVEEAWS